MNRHSTVTLITTTVLVVGMNLVSGKAIGQQPAKTLREQLVGTWKLDSLRVERKDGTTIRPFGPNPIGILMFDDKGHFSWTVVRPGRPKFASNVRLQGTPEENQAVVQGTHAYFGTYEVNAADRTLALHLDGSLFPNWDGADQTRTFSIDGDVLNYGDPAGSAGGVVYEVWKRAR